MGIGSAHPSFLPSVFPANTQCVRSLHVRPCGKVPVPNQCDWRHRCQGSCRRPTLRLSCTKRTKPLGVSFGGWAFLERTLMTSGRTCSLTCSVACQLLIQTGERWAHLREPL